MGLYTEIDSINNTRLFVYIVILLFFIFYFRDTYVGLNIILSIFCAAVVILYLNDRNNKSNEVEETRKQTKLDALRPKPRNIQYDNDIIDFLFSIQDFYQYNPQAYEEMIDNIDAFMESRDIIYLDTKFCEQYYQIAVDKKANAVNALQSLIFTIPVNVQITDKLDRAHERLETLLTKHINELYDECQKDLIVNGLNVQKTIIPTGPKAYNIYSPDTNGKFTYQFY